MRFFSKPERAQLTPELRARIQASFDEAVSDDENFPATIDPRIYHVKLIREHLGDLTGKRVLDVGCGKGELAGDLATRGGADVTGIDISRPSLEFARRRYPGVEFIEADVLTWEPPHDYDVVVLSNVLEHIAPRVDLLRRLRSAARPTRFLIRVPSEERDWLVPLRKELGLPHFSDPTHETEYTVEQLRSELHEAGLGIAELEQRWGEIWAVGTAEAGAILGR